MTARHFGIETSRQNVGRGRSDHPAGSRGANAIQFGAENKNLFPSERDLSLHEINRYAVFALSSIVISTLIAICFLLYAGKLIFGLFDLG